VVAPAHFLCWPGSASAPQRRWLAVSAFHGRVSALLDFTDKPRKEVNRPRPGRSSSATTSTHRQVHGRWTIGASCAVICSPMTRQRQDVMSAIFPGMLGTLQRPVHPPSMETRVEVQENADRPPPETSAVGIQWESRQGDKEALMVGSRRSRLVPPASRQGSSEGRDASRIDGEFRTRA